MHQEITTSVEMRNYDQLSWAKERRDEPDTGVSKQGLSETCG